MLQFFPRRRPFLLYLLSQLLGRRRRRCAKVGVIGALMVIHLHVGLGEEPRDILFEFLVLASLRLDIAMKIVVEFLIIGAEKLFKDLFDHLRAIVKVYWFVKVLF